MMVRTQVYLTEEEVKALKSLSRQSKMKQSELIRLAVDQLIERRESGRRKALIAAARGLWKDRTDLPDFQAMRLEWDRANIA